MNQPRSRTAFRQSGCQARGWDRTTPVTGARAEALPGYMILVVPPAQATLGLPHTPSFTPQLGSRPCGSAAGVAQASGQLPSGQDVLVGGAAELPAADLPASKRRRRRGTNRAWTGVDLDPCCASCFLTCGRKRGRQETSRPPTAAAAISRGGHRDGALALTACNPPTPIPLWATGDEANDQLSLESVPRFR